MGLWGIMHHAIFSKYINKNMVQNLQRYLIVPYIQTCASIIAGLMHFTLEKLQSHDGVDGDE